MRQVNLSEVNGDVKVVDGKLFFGEKEVQDCDFIKPKSVAALYVIRVKTTSIIASQETTYWSLVSGLDLHGKEFWLGGVNLKLWVNQTQMSLPSCSFQWWRQVEYVLNNLCADTAGKEWAVFEEADFEAEFAACQQEERLTDEA